MANITLKIDADLQQRMGVANQTDAISRIDELLAAEEQLKAVQEERDTAASQAAQAKAKADTDLAALTERLVALEDLVATKLDATAKADIIKQATAKANEMVVTSLGKAGVNALANPDANEADQSAKPSFVSIVKAKMANGVAKAEAVRQAVREFPEEYRAAVAKGLATI